MNTPTPDGDTTENGFLGLSRQTMGLALVLICGIGLVLIVVGTSAKGKKPKTPPSE